MADSELPPVDLAKLLLEILDHALYGNGVGHQPRGPLSFIHRAKESLKTKSPQIKESLRFNSSRISQWAQEGGPWRSLFVYVVSASSLLLIL